MSPRKAFDRFMAHNENGRNLKLMRFTDAEYRAWFGGVLPIASKADVRGAFMVGTTPATAEDVTHQSPKTTRKTADALLTKARAMGMLEFDEELGAEWVHDWDAFNPTPKTDNTAAERKARQRARDNAVTEDVSRRDTRDVTPPEVEVEGEVEKNPPLPPQGGRDRDRQRYEDELRAFASWLLPDRNDAYEQVRGHLGRLRSKSRDGQVTTAQLRAHLGLWLVGEEAA